MKHEALLAALGGVRETGPAPPEQEQLVRAAAFDPGARPVPPRPPMTGGQQLAAVLAAAGVRQLPKQEGNPWHRYEIEQ